MENYQGDLTDILRATACGGNTNNNNDVAAPDSHFSASLSYDWQDPISFPTNPVDDFGDPFSHLGDPLLHDADNPITAITSSFFHNAPDDVTMMKNRDSAVAGFERNKGRVLGPDFDGETMIKRHNGSNIFSRMLQISPTTTSAKLPLPTSSSDHHHQPFIDSTGSASKVPHRAASVANDRHHHHPHNRVLNISSRANCSVDQSPNLQISSPRNTGIKRRKSQTKKVVCIPAPTPANSSKASGEIVPSDLWAWRKYGQKPIKGSPYPRGYYRCSSSKGCSARKQVERSRTDPNMLVITYTSEHNHPWPTQRNALAGSTRSQQSKNIAKSNELKAHEKPNHKSSFDRDHASSSMNTDLDHFDDGQLDTDQDQEFMNEHGLLFPRGYKPTLQDPNNGTEDHSFFDELHEIDRGNSLDVLFKQGFAGTDDEEYDDIGSDQIQNKDLDPFSFYDWSGTNNDKDTISSAGGTTRNSKEDS